MRMSTLPFLTIGAKPKALAAVFGKYPRRSLLLGLLLLGAAPAAHGSGATAQATFNDLSAGAVIGQQGGSGFASTNNWAAAFGSGISVASGDLAAPYYVNTGYALTQSGTAQHLYSAGSSACVDRLIANGGLTNGTMWFSFLARVDSGGRAGIEIDDPQNSAYNRVLVRNTTTATAASVQLYIDSPTPVTLDLPSTTTLVGSNVLIVGRLTLNTSGANDTVDVWVNPDVTSSAVYNAPVGGGQATTSQMNWDTASSGAGAPGVQYMGVVAYAGGHVDNVVFSDSPIGYAQVTGFQPPLPVLNVTATGNASEPSTPGTFSISRSGVLNTAVTVYYYFSGSAVQGTDYNESGSGMATFAPGVTNVTVTINPINSTVPEPVRSVTINLDSDPSFALANGTATLSLYDANDANALVWYMFTSGAAPDYVFDTNVIANPLTGIGTVDNLYYVSPPNSWLMSGNQAANSEASAVANNSYVSMVVAPTAGHSLTLTNLEFQSIYGNYYDFDTSTTGAVVFVRSSLDNFASDLASFAMVPDTAGGAWQTNEIYFGGTFAEVSSPIEIRLYAYDDTTMSVVGVRLDNIFIRGYSSTALESDQVSIVASQPNASEPSTNGAFTVTRYGSTNAALNVFYAISGTASNGVDYATLSGLATIAAGGSNVIVPVQVINKANIDPTRAVVLTLVTNSSYSVVSPSAATVSIADNKTGFSVAATDNNAYKRLASLSGWFTISRIGDLSYPVTVNFGLGGTAVLGSDYVPSVTNSVTFGAGVSSVGIQIIPIESGVLTGDRTVTLTLQSSANYLLAAPVSDTVTVVDDQLPPAPVLWTDNFDSGNSGTNYTITSTTSDYLADAAFDYSTVGVPPAPGSTNTIGLKLMADLADGKRAAVNLYPIGQTFSGNFALRFSAYVTFDYASDNDRNLLIFGLNQTGTAVNYVTDASGWPGYGEGVIATMATRVGQPDIFDLYAETNDAGYLGRMTYAEEQPAIFNSPPYTELGRPDNFYLSSTPTWVDMELSQVSNVITLKANNTQVLQFTNTTAATNGNIVIGFAHASDNVQSQNTYAIVDNLRVVNLTSATQPFITSVAVSGGNVTIKFTGGASDTPGLFKLLSSPVAGGSYANEASAVISGSAGSFQAVAPVNGAARFYRIQR